jgi:uncharacterized protein YdhG (YjbR/CyaY superfamily)
MTSKEVDAYLAALPKEKRDTLQKLRKTIQAMVPDAEEVITYRLLGVKYKGKPLVGYNAATNHCAFYVMSNTALKGFKDELKGYDTDTGTVRFPVGSALPATLVKKLVRARMREIESSIKRKK